MVLEQSDSFIETLPVWLNNNSVIFMGHKGVSMWQTMMKTALKIIAENAFDFKIKD